MLTKQRFIDDACLPAAVETVNRMRKWLNTNFNMINEVMAGAKRLKSGLLDKRSRTALAEIFETTPEGVHAHLSTSYTHAVYVEVRTSFKAKDREDSSWKYDKETIGFEPGKPLTSWQPLRMYDLDEIRSGVIDYFEKYAVAEKAEDAAHNAARPLAPFCLR